MKTLMHRTGAFGNRQSFYLFFFVVHGFTETMRYPSAFASAVDSQKVVAPIGKLSVANSFRKHFNGVVVDTGKEREREGKREIKSSDDGWPLEPLLLRIYSRALLGASLGGRWSTPLVFSFFLLFSMLFASSAFGIGIFWIEGCLNENRHLWYVLWLLLYD